MSATGGEAAPGLRVLCLLPALLGCATSLLPAIGLSRAVSGRLELVVFVQEDASRARVEELRALLAARPEAAAAAFLDRDAVRDELARDDELAAVLGGLEVNPLPSLLRVRLRAGWSARTSVEALSAFAKSRGEGVVDEVSYGGAPAEALLAAAARARALGALSSIALLSLAVFALRAVSRVSPAGRGASARAGAFAGACAAVLAGFLCAVAAVLWREAAPGGGPTFLPGPTEPALWVLLALLPGAGALLGAAGGRGAPAEAPLLAAAALLATLAAGGPAYAAGASAPAAPEATRTAEAHGRAQQQLAAIRERIRREVALAERSRQKERGLLRQIERLDRKVAQARRRERAARARVQEAQRAVWDAERALRREQARAGGHRAAAAVRLRWLLARQVGDGLPQAFRGESFADGELRMRAVRRVAAADAAMFRRARENVRAISDRRLELSRTRDGLARAEERRRAEAATAAAQRREKDRLLRRVKGERASALQMLRELSSASETLQGMLSEMERGAALPPAGARLSNWKGKLPWPAAGKVRSPFGRQRHPQFNTYVFNRGIEIAAEAGASVSAPAAGLVAFADWFRGYGQMVVLDHGDGLFTVYAHLGEISARVNEAVAAGRVLGRVGETGSSSGPGLYFEIRRNGAAENPLHWLRR